MREWILAGAARMTLVGTIAATAPCFAAPPAPASSGGIASTAPKLQPGSFDPSDVYFQAWLGVRDAESLEKQKDYAGAREKLKSAQELFNSIATYHPEWKADMVKGRQATTSETLERIQPLADEQQKKSHAAVAELEGAPVNPNDIRRAPNGPAIAQPPAVSPLEAQRLKAQQEEVARLREQLNRPRTQSTADAMEASRNADRIQDLQRKSAMLESQLYQTKQELQVTRSRLNQATAQNSQSSRDSQRVAELQRTVETLEAQLQQARGQAGQAQDSDRQREALATRLRQAETDLAATRARLAAAPVQSEVDNLNRRIEDLEKEREAMGLALTQSRSEQMQAKAKIATLETDLKLLNQEHANLDRNLKLERSVANDVVSGQQSQLKKLGDQLAAKDKELSAAHNRIGSLEHELEETRQSFADLRKEHEGLLKQRDQMNALLNMDKAGRVQELIDQNLTLHRELREANEKVERLQANSEENNDALTEALRDLAIAKARIIQLQKDTRAQNDRLVDLQSRLQNTEQDLAQNPSGNPEEVEMLRNIVQRQIRAQKRRVQTKNLLIEQIEKIGNQDEAVRGALALYKGQDEVELSPQETKLIADRKVDDEFVFSRIPATEEERSRANASASRNVEANDRAATRAFGSQRFHAARELFEASLEAKPGDVSSLCKLGVVNLRLDEWDLAAENFRNAVTMSETNAFAQRMLGATLFKMQDYANAKTSLEKAVVLDPTDAKAHVYLGTLTLMEGKPEVAERHFKEAIQADPNLSDSYFNLAVLCSRTGRTEEGKDYYQQALSNGAMPDPKLEQQLAAQ